MPYVYRMADGKFHVHANLNVKKESLNDSICELCQNFIIESSITLEQIGLDSF